MEQIDEIKIVRSAWFTSGQINQAFGYSKRLCDRVDTDIANGGYGVNILDKEGKTYQERREAARKLLAVRPDLRVRHRKTC